MKKKNLFLGIMILTMIISQTSLCFGYTKTTRESNHKFYGANNPDYGIQVWSITTELTVDYYYSGSNKVFSKYKIYAAGGKHLPPIPEGNYYFPYGMKTYSGSTLIGTDKRNTFSYYEIIYDPGTTYVHMHGQKNVSYLIPKTKTGKVSVDCMFNVNGWLPLPGTSWWNNVTVTI